MLNPKTILVTGGAGYVGSHVALLMAQKGYHVVVLDSLLHGQTFDHNWATFIKGDCADTQLLNAIFTENDVLAVVHCAALIEVGKSVTDPLSFYENNVSKTITLLTSMHEHGVKNIIFSSSCAVYGEPETIPIPDDHPKNPISPYGNTKLMIETIFKDAHNAHGLRFVALRYFNASGALPEHGLGEVHVPETHIIPLLLRAALQKKPFYIFGNNHQTPDSTCIRDYIHVWDIAHAHLLALEHLDAGLPSDCFNLGTGKGVSVRQMVQAVKNITGMNIETIEHPKRAGDPPMLVADASKAHDILRWEPRYSDVEHIVRTAYQFEIHALHEKEQAMLEKQ